MPRIVEQKDLNRMMWYCRKLPTCLSWVDTRKSSTRRVVRLLIFHTFIVMHCCTHIFLLLVQVWEELEHGEFYIGTAWWQWDALCEWKYHNDEYGLYHWKVGSGLGGGWWFDDCRTFLTYRSTRIGGQKIHHRIQVTGDICVRLFYFLLLFLFPSPCAILQVSSDGFSGSGPRKCGIGQQGACVCARALSLFPHGAVVQAPSEIRSLILEFWATMGLIVTALWDG